MPFHDMRVAPRTVWFRAQRQVLAGALAVCTGSTQGVCRRHSLVSEVAGTILEFPEGWASGLEEAFQVVILYFRVKPIIKLSSSSASP